MPFDGNGNYSPPTPAYPAQSGTTIEASDRNTIDADIAAALTKCVTRDGQSPMQAALPMGGNKITGLANGTASSDAVAFGQLATVLPAGIMLDHGGTAAPAGFLPCDGAAVSRITYANLFSAIGTTWGAGDGSTTFNVPNMQRRTSIGSGGVAVSGPANTVGATGGEETHVLTTAELAAHSHGVTDPGHGHTVNDGGHVHSGGRNSQAAGAGPGWGSTFVSQLSDLVNTALAFTGISINGAGTGISIQNTGSGNAHNNMQPSAVVLKIIKT